MLYATTYNDIFQAPPSSSAPANRRTRWRPSASGVLHLDRHPGRRRRPAGRRDPPEGIRRLDLSRYEKCLSLRRGRKITKYRLPGKFPRGTIRLLRSLRRQTSQQALLQPAARPNFFSSRRNTLSQTLLAFGTRCQPRRCLRSSRWTSVASSYRSNPTHRVSPSPFQPARCQPLRSLERFAERPTDYLSMIN